MISYDKKADVLYISFGEPKPAITEEIEEGLLLRICLETKAFIGVTILDLKRHLE